MIAGMTGGEMDIFFCGGVLRNGKLWEPIPAQRRGSAEKEP